jgi:lipopolysaccharide assembly protein A
MWLLNAAIFFVLFAFALNNQAPVTLHLFFGVAWQAPLVLVLLAVLVLGLFLGVIVMLPLWLRARRARSVAAATPVSMSPNGVPPAPGTPVITDAVDNRHGT